jgi:hypothetical protein
VIRIVKRTWSLEDVKVQFGRIKRIVQGKTISIPYKLTNTSDAYLVFSPGENKYGSISIQGDRLIYNTMAQSATGPVFFQIRDPLAPKITIPQSIDVRFFQSGKMQKRIMRAYMRLDEETVPQLFTSDRRPRDAPPTPSQSMIAPVAPSRATELSYRRVDDLDEFLKKVKKGPVEVVVPRAYQENVHRLLDFTLELDVASDTEFQELYRKYKPQDLVELEKLGYTALATRRGTVLLREGRATWIGRFELAALQRMEEEQKDKMVIWVQPTKGPIASLLEEYGEENVRDQMYHGRFPYFLRLPKSAFLDFFRCIRKGEYRVVAGRGMFYESDVWVLKEE